jgi:hypothetical protein
MTTMNTITKQIIPSWPNKNQQESCSVNVPNIPSSNIATNEYRTLDSRIAALHLQLLPQLLRHHIHRPRQESVQINAVRKNIHALHTRMEWAGQLEAAAVGWMR